MNLRATSGLIAIFFGLLISSCATQMSLEEAKKVTIATTEKSFVPLPRKTNDIYELLKKKGTFKSIMTTTYIEKADLRHLCC